MSLIIIVPKKAWINMLNLGASEFSGSLHCGTIVNSGINIYIYIYIVTCDILERSRIQQLSFHHNESYHRLTTILLPNKNSSGMPFKDRKSSHFFCCFLQWHVSAKFFSFIMAPYQDVLFHIRTSYLKLGRPI